jgi:hypothetical protein
MRGGSEGEGELAMNEVVGQMKGAAARHAASATHPRGGSEEEVKEKVEL